MQRQTKRFGAVSLVLTPRGLGWISMKRFTNQAQTFAKMSKKVKKSQEATVKTKLLCMDADVVTNEKQFAIGDKIKAEVVYVDEDNLRITQVQNNRKQQTESPERKFKDLTGSLHGKISKTDFGVTLHLYVRHGDYKNARALADIFESETEQMCDVLGDMKLGEEADPCDK